jgi:hypothetical protein
MALKSQAEEVIETILELHTMKRVLSTWCVSVGHTDTELKQTDAPLCTRSYLEVYVLFASVNS